MQQNNIGLSSIVKEAFILYLQKGIEEIQPITEKLKKFKEREAKSRLRVVASRMVDEVAFMLSSFGSNEKMNTGKAEAELPAIFLAFSKNMRPNRSARGYSRVQGEAMTLAVGGSYFNTRLAFKEWDVQIAVLAQEQDNVIAIMDYLRMYFDQFQNHRWPIGWHYEGYDFNTYGMLNDGFEPEEIAVDLEDNPNIVCHAFYFPIGFMIPYISEKVEVIKSVSMQITPDEKQTLFADLADLSLSDNPEENNVSPN